jgi:hypothetical protein
MVGNIGKILSKGVDKRNMELYTFAKFQENLKVWLTNLIFGDQLSRAGMTHLQVLVEASHKLSIYTENYLYAFGHS